MQSQQNFQFIIISYKLDSFFICKANIFYQSIVQQKVIDKFVSIFQFPQHAKGSFHLMNASLVQFTHADQDTC